tara:strand:- start:152 stop:532 length:381 start_codon:yes stop_codon:yes gene_type:complete
MQQPGINNEIEAYIKARIELGAKKYGRTIYVDDKRDFLQEALEEALDMSVYLAGELIKLKNLKEKLMTTEQEHIDDKLYEEHKETLADEWSQFINELSSAIEVEPFQLERMFFIYLNKLSPNRSAK